MGRRFTNLIRAVFGSAKTKHKILTQALWGLPILSIGFIVAWIKVSFYDGVIIVNKTPLSGNEAKYEVFKFLVIGVIALVLWVILLIVRLKRSQK